MNRQEFFEHMERGRNIFNNGKTRNRYVIGMDGFFIYYRSKPNSNRVVGVFLSDFIKWAKGVGEVS